MKPVKAKARNKKISGRFGRIKSSSKQTECTTSDLSLLRQPIDTNISSVYRVNKLLESSTDEVRSILAYECDLLYECRVCRSLFRSVINFISHKRVYCKEKYDVTFARSKCDNFRTTMKAELSAKKPETTLLRNISGNDRILRSQASKGQQKTDLSAVVDMLQKKQLKNLHSTEEIVLEKVQSNSSAVYQTVPSVNSQEDGIDLMKAQVKELENMTEQTAVMGPDGQFRIHNQVENGNDPVEGSSDQEMNQSDQNDNNIVCSKCNAKFSTKKTLAAHIKALHTLHRMCFPCPCCSTVFANTWGVYRHLFKVHRKTNEQVRELRSQIQEIAFMKDTIEEDDVEREDARDLYEASSPDTDELPDMVPGDGEIPNSEDGERSLDKFTFSSHSQYCQSNESPEAIQENESQSFPETDSILSNTKTSKPVLVAVDSSSSSNDSTSVKMSIRVETVATLSKADWDLMDTTEQTSQKTNATLVASSDRSWCSKENGLHRSPVNDLSEIPEIVYSNLNRTNTASPSVETKKRRRGKEKRTDTGTNIGISNVSLDTNGESHLEQVDNSLLMEKKLASIADLEELQCLPCKRKFTSVTNLRKHAALHIGWNRYRCKLCDYKCFVKCDCVAHCNKMHNAQNNRAIIEEMIVQISQEEYVCDRSAVSNVTTIDDNPRTTEILKVAIPPPDLIKLKTNEEVLNVNQTEIKTAVGTNDFLPTKKVTSEKKEMEDDDSNEPKYNESNLLKSINVSPGSSLDPDIRRMVMEVIFGPTNEFVDNTESTLGNEDTRVTSQNCTSEKNDTSTGTRKSISPRKRNSLSLQDNNPRVCIRASDVISTSDIGFRLQKTKAAFPTESNSLKKRERSDSPRVPQETSKSLSTQKKTCQKFTQSVQKLRSVRRPVRKRIKPLNKDFIYDLEEMTFHRESLIWNHYGNSIKSQSLPREDTKNEKVQPSKRFKSVSEDGVSILGDKTVRLTSDNLSNSYAVSQCSS